MRFALISAFVVMACSSCRQTTEPPTDVTVSLIANTTVVPRGDTVTFTVIAAGNNLFGVVIDYGDATSDQYATGGALTARVTFKHAYAVAGSYTIRATVTDAILGERESVVSLVVN